VTLIIEIAVGVPSNRPSLPLSLSSVLPPLRLLLLLLLLLLQSPRDLKLLSSVRSPLSPLSPPPASSASVALSLILPRVDIPLLLP